MKTIVSYPGNMSHAQQIALAMLEAGALQTFVTTFGFDESGRLASLLKRIPSSISMRLLRQLKRRAIVEVPSRYVRCYPMWEIVRSGAQKIRLDPRIVDSLWDHSSCTFDAIVARRHVAGSDAVQAFEYTALASFERAQKVGVARILHIPSLDSAQFREIERRERREWEELTSEHDAYFETKFQQRRERRLREIALADVIVANSALTAKSHISAGADPSKIFVAGLGAPPAVADVKMAAGNWRRPLSVLYAGPFSLRKGAQYLLRAWTILNAGTAATLDVYGSMELPDRALASAAAGIVFHGSVPRPILFDAYETADVLVFPTLSDGFGLVVAEALAHGLPVITTDQAGAVDLLTPESGLVVPAADPNALADKLRWCLDNREKLYSMRFNALEAARRRQWRDFRRDLINALNTGLRLKGYALNFRLP